MRVSHFASLQVIVPPTDYAPGSTSNARLKTVGMAQNISVDDNFGSRGENVLGTPLAVLAPGYMMTNIRIEKATIDGSDFRSLGAFNPLWAHVGSTYRESSHIRTGTALNVVESGVGTEAGNEAMFPFMFVLSVRNRVSDSTAHSNITHDNKPAPAGDHTNSRTNPFGMYVCVLQSASIGMNSGNALILDSVSAIARPISGNWLSKTIKEAFADNGSDPMNGMASVVYSILHGYYS